MLNFVQSLWCGAVRQAIENRSVCMFWVGTKEWSALSVCLNSSLAVQPGHYSDSVVGHTSHVTRPFSSAIVWKCGDIIYSGIGIQDNGLLLLCWAFSTSAILRARPQLPRICMVPCTGIANFVDIP